MKKIVLILAFIIFVAVFVSVATLIYINHQGKKISAMNYPVTIQSSFAIQSIDTMKYSRDLSRRS